MSACARPAEPPVGQAAPAVYRNARIVEFDRDGTGDAVSCIKRRVGEGRDRPWCRRQRVKEQIRAVARRPRRDGSDGVTGRNGRGRPVVGIRGRK